MASPGVLAGERARLEALIRTISDESSGRDAQMDARSRLGLVLFKCAIVDAHQTFHLIVQAMDTMGAAHGRSIVFLAACSYCLSFLPIGERAALEEWALDACLNHAESRDANYLADLAMFLKGGGAQILPAPHAFISNLLLKPHGDCEMVGRAVRRIIARDVANLSPELWDCVRALGVRSDLLGLLAAVVLARHIDPPGSAELLELLVQRVREGCESERGFWMIEYSLTIFGWLVAHRKLTPEGLTLGYASTPLRVLALQCWVEYAAWGDLSKLPEFERSDDPSIRKAYLKLIGNASENVDFSPIQSACRTGSGPGFSRGPTGEGPPKWEARACARWALMN